MATDPASFFLPWQAAFHIEDTDGEVKTSFNVCLCCAALVAEELKIYHYEFHIKHGDLPRKKR